MSNGPSNDPDRFERLPPTASERRVSGRPTRRAILDFLDDRYGIPPATFEGFSFWERGAGKIWLLRGDAPTPIAIEGLGLAALRTRQDHWKPTLEFAQRLGDAAERNVIHLDERAAATFFAGESQERDWDGDWGYLLVAHEVAGEPTVLGVGLYLHGELRSQVPKGRRRDFRD